MIVIGLTGSIGMGKTTAANMLRGMGIPVHCSDEAVARLYHDAAVIAEIRAAIPECYDAASGKIDKSRLRGLVHMNGERLDTLQRILHPRVREAQQEFLKAQALSGVKIAALDIPLLFETRAESRLDYTLCVTAPAFIQEQRVMARPGMTREMLDFMLSRQMPDAEKKKRADYVIETGQGLAHTRRMLEDALADIKKKHSANLKKEGKNEGRHFPPHNL